MISITGTAQPPVTGFTIPQAQGCGQFGYGFKNRCYYFGEDPATGTRPFFNFEDARAFCQTKYPGTDLLIYKSSDDRDYVNSQVARLGLEFWVGLRESTTSLSSWMAFSNWVDGTYMSYSNWASLQPAPLAEGVRRCVAMHGMYSEHILPGPCIVALRRKHQLFAAWRTTHIWIERTNKYENTKKTQTNQFLCLKSRS